jgi:hypothetical protein
MLIILSTPTILYISSSNAADTNRDILISGVSTTGAFQSETVSTDAVNGQTQVATTNTYARIFRMRDATNNGTWGGTSHLLGDLYVSITNGDVLLGVPQTASDIKAKILAGNGSTLLGIYTIPLGFTGFLRQFNFFSDKDKVTTAKVRVRLFGGVDFIADDIDAAPPSVGLEIESLSDIPEKSDIIASAAVQAGGIASVQFDLMLIRNDLVSPNELA